MSKFTFKLDNRMKLVAEKISPRINLFIVRGSNDYIFRINSKKTRELLQVLKDSIDLKYSRLSCELTGSEYNEEGVLYIDCFNGEYSLAIFCKRSKICKRGKILAINFNKKYLKKLYKTLKEVYEIE